MAPDLVNQLHQLEKQVSEGLLSDIPCLSKAIYLYGVVQTVLDVPAEMINLMSIPAVGSQTLFEHVWIEVEDVPIDPQKEELGGMIVEARNSGTLQVNNPYVLMLCMRNAGFFPVLSE